LEKVFIKI